MDAQPLQMAQNMRKLKTTLEECAGVLQVSYQQACAASADEMFAVANEREQVEAAFQLLAFQFALYRHKFPNRLEKAYRKRRDQQQRLKK